MQKDFQIKEFSYNKPFKTIVVEDEPLSRIFLQNLLKQYCPQVDVVATASTEMEAVEKITSFLPDLVFMDIELQQGTGFSVLQKTSHLPYQIIFTTALDEAGIRSIRFSGVNYLQKPIDIEYLLATIQKMDKEKNINEATTAVEYLLQTLNNNNVPRHLLVDTGNGAKYISLEEVCYIENRNGSCLFITETTEVPSMAIGLKDYEKLLAGSKFFRPHPDFIINTSKISALPNPSSGTVTMKNNISIPVSPKKDEQLQQIILNSA